VIEGQVRLSSGLPAAGVQVALFDLSDLRQGWTQVATDADGQFAFPLAAAVRPAGFGLGQNYPNPFNPGTVIPYELATTTQVRLEVFNLLGQRLATLVDGVRSAGMHTARWDARDASGHGVAAGVYVYRLTAGGATRTRQMVLVDGAAGGAVSAVPPPRTAVDPTMQTAYGLVVSGAGVVAYVDADFRVGVGPVEVVVESVELAGSGKRVQTERGVLGDVDNNGHVELLDALMVAMYVANPATVLPNGGAIALGDVNGDGAIDIADAWLIGLYASNPLDTRLPPEIGESVDLGDRGRVLAAVEFGDEWGFIDPQGNYVINPQFDSASSFSEGLAAVRVGDGDTGKWGFIDPQGNYVINPQFDYASSFSEGLAAVRVGDGDTGKWGFIDPQGDYVINPQFDDTSSFSEGLAAVRVGGWDTGKWGFIDPQGNYVINPQFDRLHSFRQSF